MLKKLIHNVELLFDDDGTYKETTQHKKYIYPQFAKQHNNRVVKTIGQAIKLLVLFHMMDDHQRGGNKTQGI